MNTEEKIEVMKAWLDGKTIGWGGSDRTWTYPSGPTWTGDIDYFVVKPEPTTKLMSEWFKELPEHIQWALPDEYMDGGCYSLEKAICHLPSWDWTEQGRDFWCRVSNADYPTKAETVLATWKDVKVRNNTVSDKSSYFIPQTVKGGTVHGVDQNGYECCWSFKNLKDWELYTEPERKLIDPVRLLGKILWRDSLGLSTILITFSNLEHVERWAIHGYQWSDTVDSEKHSMWVEEN